MTDRDHPPTPALLLGLPSPPDGVQSARLVQTGGRSEVQALRLWPRPGAWRLRPGSRTWTPTNVAVAIDVRYAEPCFVAPPAPLDHWNPPLSDVAAEAVPPEVRDAVEAVHHRMQLRLLRLLDRAPAAIALARNDLTLLVALCSRRGAAARLLPLLHGRRRGLLPLVGLLAAPWILRVLSRVPTHDLSPARLDRLLRALRDGTLQQHKMLRHAHHLEQEVLDVICGPHVDMVAPMFVDELTYYDGLCLGGELNIHWSVPCAVNQALKRVRSSAGGWHGRPFRSLRALRRALVAIGHCEPAADDVMAVWDPARYPSFPQPPAGPLTLLTTPRLSLRPLATAVDLRRHGRSQRNCLVMVRGYPARTASGAGYGYEVRWDQGADAAAGTLWLDKRGGRGWRVSELQLTWNASPPPWVARALQTWTRDHLRRKGRGRDPRQQVLVFGPMDPAS